MTHDSALSNLTAMAHFCGEAYTQNVNFAIAVCNVNLTAISQRVYCGTYEALIHRILYQAEAYLGFTTDEVGLIL